MTVITGTELAKELPEIRPEIPVLLCTGFSGDIDEAGTKMAGIRGYCLKPIRKTDFAVKIQEVLDI